MPHQLDPRSGVQAPFEFVLHGSRNAQPQLLNVDHGLVGRGHARCTVLAQMEEHFSSLSLLAYQQKRKKSELPYRFDTGGTKEECNGETPALSIALQQQWKNYSR